MGGLYGSEKDSGGWRLILVWGCISLKIVFVEESKCGWGVLEVSCGGEEGDGEGSFGALCYIWGIGSAACIIINAAFDFLAEA
jgi:hypothetical protein